MSFETSLACSDPVGCHHADRADDESRFTALPCEPDRDPPDLLQRPGHARASPTFRSIFRG